ncbi:hypothetical protein [Streptomyces sp. NPDC059122]|uniref:hypothetical protein n=1 Tax=Streptomyces sp. NPDC059122 TaxID=3346732 RepID=UPI0036B71FEF
MLVSAGVGGEPSVEVDWVDFAVSGSRQDARQGAVLYQLLRGHGLDVASARPYRKELAPELFRVDVVLWL